MSRIDVIGRAGVPGAQQVVRIAHRSRSCRDRSHGLNERLHVWVLLAGTSGHRVNRPWIRVPHAKVIGGELWRTESPTAVPITERRTTNRRGFGWQDTPNSTLDYGDLFEHAPAGCMLLDASGCIDKINHAAAAILGWDASWLAGKPFSRWVANGDKQLFADHRQKLRSTAACLRQELRIKNRQGRLVSLRLESVCTTKGCDGAAGYRCTMVDVSGEQQSAREHGRRAGFQPCA
jgi:PAS domain S-box-containing protein